MRVDLFDFDLSPERIALRPAVPRDAARLLIIRPHGSPRFEDRAVLDPPDQFGPGDGLALNDARVIRARRANETTINASINRLGLGPGLRAPRELASMHGAALAGRTDVLAE